MVRFCQTLIAGHHRRKRPRHGVSTLVAVLATLSLLLAACGGAEDAGDGEAAEGQAQDVTDDTGATEEAAADGGAAGDGGEAFYAGKTIELVVPFGAGGGSDLVGRYYAEWLSETLPGNPTVVVVNEEGGGGLVGWNKYANQRPHDGLSLIMGSSTPHSLFVYGAEGVEYDLNNFTPLIATPTGNIMYVSPSANVSGPEDLLNDDVTLEFPGIVPVGGDLYKVLPLIIVGADVNETWGYESSGAAQIAFEQGEANVDVASGPNYLRDVLPKVEAGDAIPLLATGQIGEGNELVRDPLTPDIPTTKEVYEMLHGEPPSGDLWDSYLQQTAVVNTLGRTLWIHSDAPPEAVSALQETMGSWIDNEEYMAANEEVNGGYPPNTGEALEALVQENLFEVPPEQIEFLSEFVQERYGVTLSGE